MPVNGTLASMNCMYKSSDEGHYVRTYVRKGECEWRCSVLCVFIYTAFIVLIVRI